MLFLPWPCARGPCHRFTSRWAGKPGWFQQLASTARRWQCRRPCALARDHLPARKHLEPLLEQVRQHADEHMRPPPVGVVVVHGPELEEVLDLPMARSSPNRFLYAVTTRSAGREQFLLDPGLLEHDPFVGELAPPPLPLPREVVPEQAELSFCFPEGFLPGGGVLFGPLGVVSTGCSAPGGPSPPRGTQGPPPPPGTKHFLTTLFHFGRGGMASSLDFGPPGGQRRPSAVKVGSKAGASRQGWNLGRTVVRCVSTKGNAGHT